MRVLMIALACFSFCFLPAEEVGVNRDTVIAIRKFAAEGHPEGQVLMGFLFELGIGVEQDFREAALWYSIAAHGGNRLAFARWGFLTFFGLGVPKNEQLGMLLICIGPYEDLLPNLSQEDKATAEEIRALWDLFDFEYKPLSFAACYLPKTPSFDESSYVIRLASDRLDPQDANERIYGPGTGDWNTGVLRSDYEQMQRDHRELLRKIGDLNTLADTMKLEDIRKEAARLQSEADRCKSDSYKKFWFAVGEAVGAGALVLEIPPAALFEAFRAVEGFKEAADRYVQATNIEKEARALLDLEKSLDRARAFGRKE